MSKLTHIDAEGNSRMVDILGKPLVKRVAVAQGYIRLSPNSLEVVRSGVSHKGDVLSIAQLSGIMGTKHTASLIPLCHPIPIDQVSVELVPDDTGVRITATVGTVWKTGVEMEALTAVSTAALTIYDMLKAIDKDMVIQEIFLLEKSKTPLEQPI